MSDPTLITSYVTQQGQTIYSDDELPEYRRPTIGTKCGCPCHLDPDYWPKPYRGRCCSTLHKEATDECQV